ncbi:hypothetical protein [Sporomusa paucivorans]|uniref:hypothetical protein n=1 Tax=Sporomusa paucivorans TaxID=2376 RepID=UPI003570D992
MRKIIAALTMGLVLTATPVSASPTAVFEQGAIILELGSTLNSKVKGQGSFNVEADGDFGYKYSITTGLSDKFALQYKQGYFRSETKTILVPGKGSLTTYAKSEPMDINLLYKVNPTISLLAGYEHSKISYGDYVAAASHSTFHVGVTATHKLDDKATLFATAVRGSGASLNEAGISYKLSAASAFTVSYAERKVKDVDLKILTAPTQKADYTMTGITCMFGTRL